MRIFIPIVTKPGKTEEHWGLQPSSNLSQVDTEKIG